MRRTLLIALATLLVLSVVPAGADSHPPESVVDCGPDESRELLTPDGVELEIAAPTGYPDPGAVREESEERTVPFRNANLYYRADLAPSASARVAFELSWEGAGDYDLHVVKGARQTYVSEAANVDDLTESVSLPIDHCDDLHVIIRNYSGSPAVPLALTATVTDEAGALTCIQDDPAPGCDGLAEGDAPVRVEDTRTFHYLTGTPGQVSMAHDFVGDPDNPLRPATSEERPNTPVWNSYTRPMVGFDNYRNPFLPWFPVEFDGLETIEGDVSALVYVSSPTLAGDADAGIEPGTLSVSLWANGGAEIGRVDVPGSQIRDVPTPVLVTFEDISRNVRSLDLQVGTEPTVSSGGQGEPADANHTVWYDSVQFPSRLTLP